MNAPIQTDEKQSSWYRTLYFLVLIILASSKVDTVITELAIRIYSLVTKCEL